MLSLTQQPLGEGQEHAGGAGHLTVARLAPRPVSGFFTQHEGLGRPPVLPVLPVLVLPGSLPAPPVPSPLLNEASAVICLLPLQPLSHFLGVDQEVTSAPRRSQISFPTPLRPFSLPFLPSGDRLATNSRGSVLLMRDRACGAQQHMFVTHDVIRRRKSQSPAFH